MWPLESEFGIEHVDYDDLQVGDLLIGVRGSRLWSPNTIYRVDCLREGHENFELSEFCRTNSHTPIFVGQGYYVSKFRVGSDLNRVMRIQDIKLKRYLKSFSMANVFDPNQLRELLIELEI